jgi:hypothetical protein
MSPKVNLQIQFELRCTPAEFRARATTWRALPDFRPA